MQLTALAGADPNAKDACLSTRASGTFAAGIVMVIAASPQAATSNTIAAENIPSSSFYAIGIPGGRRQIQRSRHAGDAIASTRAFTRDSTSPLGA